MGVAPDWIDHNQSDPGITVLELVAYGILFLLLVAVGVRLIRDRLRDRRPCPSASDSGR